MWAVQDLSRLLHCLAGWACRKFHLNCLHIAIKLGGGEDAAAACDPLGKMRSPSAEGSKPGVVVAVGGAAGPQESSQAAAFVNKELNEVLMA
jgi:hypothetical protein